MSFDFLRVLKGGREFIDTRCGVIKSADVNRSLLFRRGIDDALSSQSMYSLSLADNFCPTAAAMSEPENIQRIRLEYWLILGISWPKVNILLILWEIVVLLSRWNSNSEHRLHEELCTGPNFIWSLHLCTKALSAGLDYCNFIYDSSRPRNGILLVHIHTVLTAGTSTQFTFLGSRSSISLTQLKNLATSPIYQNLVSEYR